MCSSPYTFFSCSIASSALSPPSPPLQGNLSQEEVQKESGTSNVPVTSTTLVTTNVEVGPSQTTTTVVTPTTEVAKKASSKELALSKELAAQPAKSPTPVSPSPLASLLNEAKIKSSGFTELLLSIEKRYKVCYSKTLSE